MARDALTDTIGRSRRNSHKKLTIQDVARAAGTSPSTVSRVLTGNAPVADETRVAVLQAIEKLNFRPNLVARSLKLRQTHSIGLLINDILNPFYGAPAKGVEDRVGPSGYAVMFCNTNEDPIRELNYLRMLHDKAVDGIVLAPTGGNVAELEALRTAGVAMVQVDRRLPDLQTSSVVLDNETGAFEATRHLIAQGHSRIGLVTYAIGQMTVVERERGYRRAMVGAGLPARAADSWRVGFDINDIPARVARLLKASPGISALFVANNRIAIGVLRALDELGLSVPEDIALVVFDDIELFEFSRPTITAVLQPSYAMGQKAAELLLEQLTSSGPAPLQTSVFQPQLIIRESSPAVGT